MTAAMYWISAIAFPLMNVVALIACLVIGRRQPGQTWRLLGAAGFGIAALAGLMYLILGVAQRRASDYDLIQTLYGLTNMLNTFLGLASTALTVAAVVAGRNLLKNRQDGSRQQGGYPAGQWGQSSGTGSDPSNQGQYDQPSGYQQGQPGQSPYGQQGAYQQGQPSPTPYGQPGQQQYPPAGHQYSPPNQPTQAWPSPYPPPAQTEFTQPEFTQPSQGQYGQPGASSQRDPYARPEAQTETSEISGDGAGPDEDGSASGENKPGPTS